MDQYPILEVENIYLDKDKTIEGFENLKKMLSAQALTAPDHVSLKLYSQAVLLNSLVDMIIDGTFDPDI